jgi:hypothetical protein
MDAAEIARRFRYHAPNDATRLLHEEVRHQVIKFAERLDELLPGESREKSLAFTALEESQFWAHAYLARNVGRDE